MMSDPTSAALPPLPSHMIVDSQIAEWMRAYALRSIAADRAAREEPVARAVTGRDGWPNVVSYDKDHFARQEREFGTVAFYAAPRGEAAAQPGWVPARYVLADQAMDVRQLYADLCDVWAEAGAVDTPIGRHDVLMAKLTKLRDAIGGAVNAYIPLAVPSPAAGAIEPLPEIMGEPRPVVPEPIPRPETREAPAGGPTDVCGNCRGSGVIGVPGGPCPFCKVYELGRRYRELQSDA